MKKLRGVELSHHLAPLSIREKISMDNQSVMSALNDFKQTIPECFIISTCNRLSLYGITDDTNQFESFFDRFGDLQPYLIKLQSETDSAQHLFRTASGLQSQALGEHEILGQIKKAYLMAQEAATLSPTLDEFIRRSIYTGKKVRQFTAIGKYPVSLASVAYDLLCKRYKDFKSQDVLVLGTGEMSNLMMKILAKKHTGNLYIASRTKSRAESMANMFGGKAIDMTEIKQYLPMVEIVIGATHAEKYVLQDKDLKAIRERGLTLLDLGMPRNFAPEIKRLGHIDLFDLDDLKSLTDVGIQKRHEEIPKAEVIIGEEVESFTAWLKIREVSPLITSYYEKLEKIKAEELKWALPKLGNIDKKQQEIIENMISRVTRRLSGKPIERLRQYSQTPNDEQNPIDTFKSIFDL